MHDLILTLYQVKKNKEGKCVPQNQSQQPRNYDRIQTTLCYQLNNTDDTLLTLKQLIVRIYWLISGLHIHISTQNTNNWDIIDLCNMMEVFSFFQCVIIFHFTSTTQCALCDWLKQLLHESLKPFVTGGREKPQRGITSWQVSWESYIYHYSTQASNCLCN